MTLKFSWSLSWSSDEVRVVCWSCEPLDPRTTRSLCTRSLINTNSVAGHALRSIQSLRSLTKSQFSLNSVNGQQSLSNRKSPFCSHTELHGAIGRLQVNADYSSFGEARSARVRPIGFRLKNSIWNSFTNFIWELRLRTSFKRSGTS